MKETLERYEEIRKKAYNTYMCINKELARYYGRIESAKLIYADGVITEEAFDEIIDKYNAITEPLAELERVVEKYREYVDYKMGQDYPECAGPFDDFIEVDKLTESEYETLRKAFELETEILFSEVSDGDRK